MYTDEQILQMKKNLEQMRRQREEAERIEIENQKSIYEGSVTMLGEEIPFAEREIQDLGIRMWMPVEFELLEDSMRKLVYPNASGPTHVFTREKELMNVSFKQNNNVVPSENMKEFTNLSKRLLEVTGPKVKIVKTHELQAEDLTIGVIEFISEAIDGVLYNYLGLVPLKKGVMLTTIVFKNQHKKRFLPVVQEMMGSIRELEENREEVQEHGDTL